jgi:hypothetical protein
MIQRGKMSIWLFRALRWLLTLIYGLLVFLAIVIGAEIDVPAKAISVIAVTAAYGILMMLLWLYERYPPQQHRRLSDQLRRLDK